VLSIGSACTFLNRSLIHLRLPVTRDFSHSIRNCFRRCESIIILCALWCKQFCQNHRDFRDNVRQRSPRYYAKVRKWRSRVISTIVYSVDNIAVGRAWTNNASIFLMLTIHLLQRTAILYFTYKNLLPRSIYIPSKLYSLFLSGPSNVYRQDGKNHQRNHPGGLSKM